jgi:hypothetical protein
MVRDQRVRMVRTCNTLTLQYTQSAARSLHSTLAPLMPRCRLSAGKRCRQRKFWIQLMLQVKRRLMVLAQCRLTRGSLSSAGKRCMISTKRQVLAKCVGFA